MKKKILIIITTIIIVALCLGLIGFYFYSNYYKIDISQFNYVFLSRIVDSPDGNYLISVWIFKTSENSEISYIKGNLLSVSKQKDIPSKNIKTIFWQKVNSSDINNNWIDVIWTDKETVKINNITMNIFKDVYDYRRN